MSWQRRPDEETPRAEQRRLADDRGRRWVGTVTSGVHEGGEEHAEVVFVCEDDPNEVKRLGRLSASAGEADEAWRKMDEEEVRDVFRRSDVL